MKSAITSRTLRALTRALIPRARVARALLAVALAGLFTAACGDSASGPGRTVTVTISPTTANVVVGGTVTFTVEIKDDKGNTLANTPTWRVTSGGGSITQAGVFTAPTIPGTSTITVTCRGVVATATVTVTVGPAVSIAVLPQTTTLFPTGTQTFTATVRDAQGNIITTLTPAWTVANPPGTIVPNAGGFTAVFTAGNTLGSFPNSVAACVNTTICDQADVIVTIGPAASIAILPQTTTLFPGGTQTFTATVRDAGGNIITTLTPAWTATIPPGGTVVANAGGLTAVFTAGSTLGSFPNSVSACVNTTICDAADVIVISPPAPPALRGFTVLGRAAATCTTGTIIGDVGVFQQPGDSPPGTITASCIPVTTGTVHIPEGDPATKTAYNNFLAAYIARTPAPGDCDPAHTLTGTLAGITLAPGVYCFSAGAALTGLLTLNGTSTDLWLFKIGTTGTGDLATTGFTVTMGLGALPCNVTWWVRQAATMQDSFLKGTVIAGTGVTVTNGTFNGNMWGGASGTGDATETNAAVTGCP